MPLHFFTIADLKVFKVDFLHHKKISYCLTKHSSGPAVIAGEFCIFVRLLAIKKRFYFEKNLNCKQNQILS